MKSEKNKTLKVVEDFKFRFYKFLKIDIQRWFNTFKIPM